MKKQRNFLRSSKIEKTIVDKKGFTKYFSYEPTTLVNNLLNQKTQDLRKSLDEIKQEKIKLNKDERNSTNNKNKNDEPNNMLCVINRIYQFFEYKFLPGEQLDESNLPKWIKESKQKFHLIKKKVEIAKINNLQVRPKESKVININESNKLLYEIENSQITYEEALKRIKNIRSDANKITNMQSLNSNQINLLNILFMVNEIFTGESASVELNKEGNFEIFEEKSNKGKQESDEKPDTTDMSELDSDESAAERRNQQGKGLKILTPDQMLSRLPISLAQLKVGNNSQKLKNEIRQLLYSLYRSKKLTKQLYKSLVDII